MKNTHKILSIFLSLFFVNVLVAQTVVAPKGYQTDFEDEAEQSNWFCNYGPVGDLCANKWFFGKPGANGGEVGLFISNDGGTSASYAQSGVSVISYRELTLDEGDYEISFDWQVGGMSVVDGLYVCWIPVKDSVKTNSVNTSILQKWVSTYGLDFGRDSLRLTQRTWNTMTDTIHSDGSAYKLVFVWNNGVTGVYPPGACVDNILIMELGRCDRPTNLMATPKGDDMVLSWKGNADAYDVRCSNNLTGEWIEYTDITSTSHVIEGLSEGVCTYYVRSKCGGVAGAWVSITKFLYYPGVRCVDYLNLNSKNCFSGAAASTPNYPGVIDFGYQAKESRHTIHWDPLEYDPRTNSKLKTVPPGEIASIRLGNWEVGQRQRVLNITI